MREKAERGRMGKRETGHQKVSGGGSEDNR